MPTILTFLMYVFVVVSQSGHGTYWVSSEPNTVTYFQLPNTVYGSIGLTAHEKNVEEAFSALNVGDVIYLDTQRYRVSQIEQFLALQPLLVSSNFVSLDRMQKFDSLGLGAFIYDRPGALILQTCFDNSRGRLFVIAVPVVEKKNIVIQE